MDGVGMTHGESVETIWSHSGSLATWSRENAPGARRLVLDDHWSGWNWRKYVGLRKYLAFRLYVATNTRPGTQLKTMLTRAFEGAKTQREAANSMTLAWPQSVPAWRKMLTAYKNDQSQPNPFEEPDPSTSIRIVFATLKTNQSAGDLLDRLKRQLTQEDLEQKGSGVSFPHEVTPTGFLQLALKVESAQ